MEISLLVVFLILFVVFVLAFANARNELTARIKRLEAQMSRLNEKTLDKISPKPAKTPREEPPPLPGSENVPAPRAAFSEKLRELKILPPPDMPTETLLMQWWAPRIGGLLALFALIFFGVWASQFSSALVKISEMTAVALGITALGVFFRKRGSASLGDPLTATGTTMFYLVALAAGTFPATKIFDSIPLTLGVQLAAILPTILLGRGKLVPMHLGLAFAFVSAMFAVLNGAGTAALFTALLAYAVAAWFCRKKNTLGLLFTGMVGAYLPLWAMRFEFPKLVFTGGNHFPQVGFSYFLENPQFLLCLAFFVTAGSIVPAVLLRKEETCATKFLQAGNLLHAGTAMFAAAIHFYRPCPALYVEDFRMCSLVLGTFFIVAAMLAWSWATTYWFSQKKSSFAFQLAGIAGSLAVPPGLFILFSYCQSEMRTYYSSVTVFYYSLIAMFLIAVIGRAVRAKTFLIPVLLYGFLALGMAIEEESCLQLCGHHMGATVAALAGCISLAWFLGDPAQWSGKFSRQFARVVGCVFGLFYGALLFSPPPFYDWYGTYTEAFWPLAFFVVVCAGIFLPRFSKIPFVCAAGILAALIFVWEYFGVSKDPYYSKFLLTGTLLTLIAAPALRIFVKDEKIGGIAEACMVAPTLIFLAQYFSKTDFPSAVDVVFALPMLAMLSGICPLLRRSADISALPLFVAFFAVRWQGIADSPIFAVELFACLALPFIVPALRKMLRERAWFAASLMLSGAACLLAWGHAAFPRFLTAEAAALALAMIFAGLFARARAVRVVGIILLAGTLVRLFFFDIGETVWRIVAFAVVAAVLFLLGFAYRKLARKSEEDAA